MPVKKMTRRKFLASAAKATAAFTIGTAVVSAPGCASVKFTRGEKWKIYTSDDPRKTAREMYFKKQKQAILGPAKKKAAKPKPVEPIVLEENLVLRGNWPRILKIYKWDPKKHAEKIKFIDSVSKKLGQKPEQVLLTLEHNLVRQYSLKLLKKKVAKEETKLKRYARWVRIREGKKKAEKKPRNMKAHNKKLAYYRKDLKNIEARKAKIEASCQVIRTMLAESKRSPEREKLVKETARAIKKSHFLKRSVEKLGRKRYARE